MLYPDAVGLIIRPPMDPDPAVNVIPTLKNNVDVNFDGESDEPNRVDRNDEEGL
jgi:hypothetical protein